MRPRILSIFILILIALAAFGTGKYFKVGENYGRFEVRTIVQIGNSGVEAEVASTALNRARGLSGRELLEEDEGMLFVFEEPQRYSFWMKDMNFPIDIIWIGDNKEVVDITYDARPESFPLNFQPNYPSQYVLEVGSGWAQSRGIQVGDGVEFAL